jgi:hypothetical protein
VTVMAGYGALLRKQSFEHRRQRPAHHREDIAAAAIRLDRGWAKRKKCTPAQRAELAAPTLLSFLHLARNSAYVSFCYQQSGMTRLRATGGRRRGSDGDRAEALPSSASRIGPTPGTVITRWQPHPVPQAIPWPPARRVRHAPRLRPKPRILGTTTALGRCHRQMPPQGQPIASLAPFWQRRTNVWRRATSLAHRVKRPMPVVLGKPP